MLRSILTQELWTGQRIDGIAHPKNISDVWSVADLASIGLEPVPAQPPQTRKIVDFIEFMDLFTADEQSIIATAAMSSVPVKLWYDQAVALNRIDLASQRAFAGMSALVTAGLLTQERSTEILAAELPV